MRQIALKCKENARKAASKSRVKFKRPVLMSPPFDDYPGNIDTPRFICYNSGIMNNEPINNSNSNAAGGASGSQVRPEISHREDIYKTEIEFLKSFAHNPDFAGLYALNLNLMPSNFQSSVKTRFIYTAFLSLYNENRAINFQNARMHLNGQMHQQKSHFEVCGELCEHIFNLTGEAGESPVEADVKTLIYKIKENSLRIESKKLLASSMNKLNNDKGDYVNTIKKCAESIGVLLENSNLSGECNYEPDAVQTNIDLEIATARNNRPFCGLDTGFELLNQAINGIENEMYLIGAAGSMGKTTFATQLAFQMLKANPDANLIFFSLDQSQKDILVKFISEASGVSVKYIKCSFPRNENLDIKKKEGISYVASLTKRMRIVDESHGEVTIKDFKNIIRKHKLEFLNKPLVVIVDTISSIRPMTRYDDKLSEISDILSELKTLVRTEEFAMVATFNLDGSAEIKRPKREDLARVPAYIYQPYVTMALYSDFIFNFETPFLEWEWGSSDLMVPIVELEIIKNKMSGNKGRIFYRYLDSLASYRECVELENENYNAMIENIEHFEHKRGNQPIPPVAPPHPPVRNIQVDNKNMGESDFAARNKPKDKEKDRDKDRDEDIV